MANVDNLNFKVIIDDKQFNKKIKAMEDMAKKFNTSMSNLLNVQAVSQQLVVSNRKRLQMETDLVRATEMQNREKIKTEGLQRKINAQIERASKGYQSQSRILQELKGYALGYLSIHGASQLLSSLVRVTGEFELQKTTLAAMLGDLNAAEGVITRIQGLAVESPFQFKELTTYAKQLSAFSVPAQELYDTTKMLADISAGLGVGMDRIVLAYGQVRSAAFLRGQEVRQFTEAGIPILDELAKQFSELEGRAVSTGEVFDKISARLVPFEMVAKVFKDMTSEGGKFYNMQEVQAETLRGKISNLKDAYEVMLNEIGSGQSEKLKGAVDWARRLMQNYEDVGKTLKQCIITFGISKVAIEVLSAVTGTLATKKIGLVKSLRNVAAFAVKNPYVLLAAGVTAIGVAAYKGATALESYEKVQQSVISSNEKYNKSIASETAKLDTLFAKLQVAKRGSEDYNRAKSQIYSQYSGYISALQAEGVEVNNLGVLYSNLKDKIIEANKSKFLTTATEDVERTYGEGIDKLYKQFELLSANIGNTIGRELMAIEKESLWQYILGDDAVLNKSEAEGIRPIVTKVAGGYGYLVNEAREEAKKLSEAYIQGLADVNAAYSVTQKRLEEPIKLATGWRKTVQDTLTGMGLNKGTSFGLWAEDTTQSTEYVDDMIKRYKELGEQIKNVSSFDPDQTERLKQNKEAIEAIAKALNIDIKNLSANDSDTWESKEEKRLKRLIETLRKLQDQYDELKSLGVSDDAIKSLFKGWYPELGGDFFNNMDFLSRAKTAVEELRKYNPGAADQALVNLGGDKYTQYVDKLKEQQKAYKESAKAAGEYFNMLRKWSSEDFNLNGEGIALDVSKIASDLSEKMNEIDLRARKAKEVFGQIDVDSEEEVAKVKEIFVKEFGADAWEEFWQSYKEKGEDAITDLADKQKEYEKKLAQERVNDLAKKYVSEAYFTGGIKLTDLGDKNILQLVELKRRLQELNNDKSLDIPAEVAEKLAELGITTEKFGQIVNQVIGTDLKDLNEELKKEFMELGKLAVSQIGNIISALGELAQASGDKELESTIKLLQDSADVISSAMQGFATGGWIGAIVGGVGALAEKLINVATEAARVREEMREMQLEFGQAMREFERMQYLNSFSNIFGEADFSRYLAQLKVANDSLSNISAKMRELKSNERRIELLRPTGTELRVAADFDPLTAPTTNLTFDNRTDWQKFWGTGQKNVNEFDLNTLFDENGKPIEAKFEELKIMYEQMGDSLTAEDKETVDALLENWQNYTDAQEENVAFLNNLFGDLASSIADNMINSFIETGDAAAGLEDVFDDLGKNIAKSLLKDFLLTNFLNKYKNNIQKLFDESGGFSDEGFWSDFEKEISAMQAEMRAAMPGINKILSNLGFGSEDASLADGIKGITEDTANLLASYLNAIRADVSYARTIWERMDATTQQIAAMLVNFSVPNLMEYQAQIAANTYNTAMHTQSIMEDLRSMMTSDGGATALRVYS